MKPNTATEEANPQVDKKPDSIFTSLAKLPLWLVTSLILLLASLVSLIYFFLKKKGSKPESWQKSPSVAKSFEPMPDNKTAQPVQLKRDDIKDKPAVGTSVENIKQTEQNENPVIKWIRSLNTWSLPEISLEQIKKIALSAAGVVLALIVAYTAQGIFDSTTGAGIFRNSVWVISQTESYRLWLGSGVYLIAMLIWIFTAPAMQSIGGIVSPPDLSNTQKKGYPSIRFFLLSASIGVYFISVLLFKTGGETAFIRILWGVSLISFILSQIPWAGLDDTHPEAEKSPRFQWQNWLVLAIILAVGFWLRFYQVATIPDDFHGDMASHGLVARDFLLGIQHDIFGFGWTATPTIGFLPAFLTMAVFGNNIFGLQMAAVIGGVFSLLAVYLLIWRFFNSHRLAAITTALVAINIVHIHFSRIFNMEPWPLSNFAIFLLIDGLKARRSTSFGLAGVFLGFSMLMYTSGRALPFIIIVFFLYAIFFQRSWLVQNKRGLVLMVVGIVITMGPALIYYLINWEAFISRSREVFLFSPGVMDHLLYKYNTNSEFVVLLTQIKLTLLMFNQSSDTSSQFGFPHPMFSSILSPLIILGLGFALRRWKDAGMTFILIWLGLTAVMGSVLTLDAPFWPRLVGIIPPAAFLAAVALEQILEVGKKIFGSKSVILITAIFTIFLATAGYQNWNQYYLAVKESGSPSTVTGRYIARLPLDVTACSIISGPPLNVRETYFLAWPHKLIDIAPDAPDSALDTCTGSSIVWVISPENISRLDAIRARWPNGIVQERYLAKFNYTLTFYLIGVVPPAPLAVDAVPSAIQPEIAPKPPLQTPNNISRFIVPVILYGLLTGLFIWVLYRTLLRRRQEKIKIVPVNQNISRQSQPSASSNNIFTVANSELNQWYNEIITFRFPAVSFNLIISTLLSLSAVGLAYLAQAALDSQAGIGLHLFAKRLHLSTESQFVGVSSLIFLIAALIWTFTTTPSPTQNPKLAIAKTPLEQKRKISQQIVINPIQVVSIFFTVSAMFFYAIVGENSLARWLWLVGLGIFLASLFVKNQFDTATSREESPVFRWFHALILFLLLILAFYLRVYRLYDIPLDLSTDMASVGIGAREYLLGMENRIFGTGWYYMPRITFIPYAASMAVAGNNLFGLYFATVIMGTLNILGIYLFVWRLFDRHRLALLTAVIVTINPAHINFSRITSYMDPWFLGFFGLFFFLDGLKGRRKVSLAIAGIFTGFTLVSYPSGRAIIPLIIIGLACAWMYQRKWITDNYGGLIWMALGLLAALGPNLIYFITDWSVYMQRSREVIIFNLGNIEHLKYTYEVNSTWMVVWEQIKRSVLQFNYYTDRSAQFSYPHPMFSSLISPLLILGFGMSLYRWKKLEYLFVISSFSLILVVGSILTNDAPTWVRLVGIIPLTALLMALVLDEFVNIFERIYLKPFIPLLLLGIALFLGALAITDWKIYLRDVGNESITRPEVHIARYLDALPDEVTACGLTDEYLIDQEEIKFLGWPRTIVVVPADTVALNPEVCPGESVVWILSPTYKNRLPEIQSKWIGGIAENHLINDWLVFTSYLVNDPAPH
jgi:4-amino-4-deoxy-L-arabinose transferase-like glycosyltransferase